MRGALVLVLLAGAQESREEAHGVRFTVPRGWTRAEGVGGSVVLNPLGLGRGGTCAITIMPPSATAAKADEWHDGFWKQLVGAKKVVGSATTGTLGAFRSTAARIELGEGKVVPVAVYTAVAGGRGLALIFEASSDAAYDTHVARVREMIEKTEVIAGLARAAFGPIRIAPPAGWVRTEENGLTCFVAPDAGAGNACKLTIGAPQETPMELAEAHATMWAGYLKIGTPNGPAATGRTGAFVWSGIELKDDKGNRAYFRLFSTKAGKSYVAIQLSANAEAVADRYMEAVTAAIASAEVAGAAGKRESVGPFEFTRPDGWSRQEAAGGWTVMSPPGLADPGDCVLFIRADRPIEKTWWATHRKTWEGEAAAVGMKVEDATHTPDGPGRFIWTWGRWRKSPMLAPHVHLYTTVASDKVVTLLYMGSAAGVHSQWTFPLHRMLREATIKDAPELKRPAIVQALHCVRVRSTISGNTVIQKMHLDRLVLYANGVADISMQHNQGMAGAPYLAKVDPALDNGFFGSWKAVGEGEVHVTREGKTTVYTRDGAALRSGKDLWTPLTKVDGLKLKGRFGRGSPNDPVPIDVWIAFTEDGRFELKNVFSPFDIVDGNPVKVPSEGRGTYEIRDWTIFLKTDDGFAQSLDFFLLKDEDPKNPKGVWIQSYLYEAGK